jgi:hypothetical protein
VAPVKMSNLVVEGLKESPRSENEKASLVAEWSGERYELRRTPQRDDMEDGPVVWVCQRADLADKRQDLIRIVQGLG